MIDDWTMEDTIRNLIEDQELLSAYCMKNRVALIGFCPDRHAGNQRNLRYFFNDWNNEGYLYYQMAYDLMKPLNKG